MRIRVFLISLILSLPFWWEVNIFQAKLENFLSAKTIAENADILAAKAQQDALGEKLAELLPFKKTGVAEPEISAEAAISVAVKDDGTFKKILFQKNVTQPLPIASLTKLMAAFVVLENYDSSLQIEISKTAVSQDGDLGKLKIGEKFSAEDLLYPLLIESSNDAAQALAEVIGENGFLALMNFEGEKLGLQNTRFFNPTGLDPDDPEDPVNYSTAQDLAKLTSYFLKEKPVIWEILSNPEFDLYDEENIFHHKLKNTNKLLEESAFLQAKIIGGKTGWTPRANGCLVLVIRAPGNQGYIVNVILGSEDRFGEMEKLTAWAYQSFKWEAMEQVQLR